MTIMFHSTLDDPAEWVPRLQALLPDEEFCIWPEIGDPASVEVAIVWIPPEEGMPSFTGLKAVQSLGAGINQLAMHTFPTHVKVARLVDSGLTGTMTEYALFAALRYARNIDFHERAQRASTWDYVVPKGVGAYPVGVMGLGRDRRCHRVAAGRQRLRGARLGAVGEVAGRHCVLQRRSGTAGVPGRHAHPDQPVAADAADREHPGRQAVRHVAEGRVRREHRAWRASGGCRPDRRHRFRASRRRPRWTCSGPSRCPRIIRSGSIRAS